VWVRACCCDTSKRLTHLESLLSHSEERLLRVPSVATRVLDDATLTVHPGARAAVGRNGAGKSTRSRSTRSWVSLRARTSACNWRPPQATQGRSAVVPGLVWAVRLHCCGSDQCTLWRAEGVCRHVVGLFENTSAILYSCLPTRSQMKQPQEYHSGLTYNTSEWWFWQDKGNDIHPCI
jgi:hypothetical protein